jgi:hypothetical protein
MNKVLEAEEEEVTIEDSEVITEVENIEVITEVEEKEIEVVNVESIEEGEDLIEEMVMLKDVEDINHEMDTNQEKDTNHAKDINNVKDTKHAEAKMVNHIEAEEEEVVNEEIDKLNMKPEIWKRLVPSHNLSSSTMKTQMLIDKKVVEGISEKMVLNNKNTNLKRL